MTYLASFGEQQLTPNVNPNDIDTSSTWRQLPSAVGTGLYGAAAAGSKLAGLGQGAIATGIENILGLDHSGSEQIYHDYIDEPATRSAELEAKQTHYSAQVLSGAIKGIGQMAFGGVPGMAVTTYADRATKEIDQGASLTEANTKAMINAATTYAGAKIAFNIPGGVMAKVGGGVAANVAGGVLGRTGEKVVSNAYGNKSQDIFDPVAIGTDIVTGAAFGAGGHLLDSVYTLNAKSVVDNAMPDRPETSQAHVAQQEALYETANAINENRPADYSALEDKQFAAPPDLVPRVTSQIDTLRTHDAEAINYAQHDPVQPVTKPTINSEPFFTEAVDGGEPKAIDLFAPRETESAKGEPLPDLLKPELFDQALKDAPDQIEGMSRGAFTKEIEAQRNQITEHDSFLQRVAKCILNV